MFPRDFAQAFRLGNRIAIALAVIGFAFMLAEWWTGKAPQWTSIALPLLLVGNSVASQGIGPFRSPSVRLRYCYGSIVAAITILVAILLRISARAQ